MKKNKKLGATSSRTASNTKKENALSEPPVAVINEVVNFLNEGNFGLAEKKARDAVQHWPNHPFGWKTLANVFLMQGRLDAAIEPLAKCVKLAPDDFQSINNMGSVLLENRQLDEAEEHFREALALRPDYVQAYNNLGITLLKQGRAEEAVASYRHALSLKPDFAEAHNNLGNALRESGSLAEAETCFRQALAINPDFAEAHNNLGNVLKDQGRIGEAKSSYRQALVLNPEYAMAQCGLGDTQLKRGNLNSAISSYRKSIDLDPLLIRAHEGLNRALGAQIPPWHVPMMNDRFRNEAYFNALQNAIRPDTHVLEIGTGAGLLAMMAASLGARKVTTCEAVPEIAEMAKAIVEENGFSPTVHVIPKLSSKLIIGEDMDEPADLLVSEILSSEFLGEGVFSSIEDAKRRLLKPGAKIIPARGSIQFAIIGGADIEKNIRVGEIYGFNFSRFNDIVPGKQYYSRQDLNIELLSDDTSAFSFDFIDTKRFHYDERKLIEVPIRKEGNCCGIIQWLKLEMDDSIVFENHPSIKNPACGWQHTLYAFPQTVKVHPGQVVLIAVAHNRDTPWFFFNGMK